MTDRDQTALQSIVADEEQAEAMLDDLAELPHSDYDRWELRLEMDEDDLEVVRAELQEMVSNGTRSTAR